MDKKDIYEHLAKIYLDTPLKRQQRIHQAWDTSKKTTYVTVAAAVAAIAVLLASVIFLFAKKGIMPKNKDFAYVIQTEAAKIRFNFDPAKKEVYAITLNKLNLAPFKQLAFSLKKSNYRDTLALRVELSNTFNEKSEIYIKDISNRWKEYRLDLAGFKNINDWSEMTDLAFVLEEWNALDKSGAVYVDNIRFLR